MVTNTIGHYPANIYTKKAMNFFVKYEAYVVGLLIRRYRETLRLHFHRVSP